MKQVWVNAATCCCTASTTRGEELPIVVTAMPEPRSISRLPSTSSMIPPKARAHDTGIVTPTPRATAATRRLLISIDWGPGISVTSLRLCSTVVTTVLLNGALDGAGDQSLSGPSRDATENPPGCRT